MTPTQPEKKETKIGEEEEQFVEKKDVYDEEDEDDEEYARIMDSYEKRYRAIPLPDAEEDEDWNNAEFKKFIQTFYDTDGYIVPVKPQGVAVSPWRPARVGNGNPYVIEFSIFALQWYMDNNGVDKEKYEFLEVKHANKGSARGILYHLVFVARVVSTGDEVLFKAKVLSGIEEDSVEACELAPDLALYCSD